jgi:hypothetical protein
MEATVTREVILVFRVAQALRRDGTQLAGKADGIG